MLRDGREAHVETDALGGDDPYSASKAGAEIVTHAFRRSFFEPGQVGIATARAGNIVGGGDWSDHRIVPDFVRAAATGRGLELRRPEVRPDRGSTCSTPSLAIYDLPTPC